MQKDDIFTGLGSVGSGILAFFSWLWSIPVLQFAFTFILGTLVTYSVQSRLQDRADKRKITRENIEKIYGPLYVELQEYKRSVIEDLEAPEFQKGAFGDIKMTQWEKVKAFPEFFSIPLRLREEMDEIAKEEDDIISSLNEVKMIADSCIMDAMESIFKKHPDSELRDVTLSRESFKQTLYISARSSTGAYYSTCFLHDCLLLDENPIERVKRRFPAFSADQSKLCIVPRRTLPGDSSQPKELSLSRVLTMLQESLQEAGIKARSDKTICKLLEERKDLSQRIDKLLPMVQKYIAKHYPIEEVG